MKSERQKRLDKHHGSSKRERIYKRLAVGISVATLSIPIIITYLA